MADPWPITSRRQLLTSTLALGAATSIYEPVEPRLYRFLYAPGFGQAGDAAHELCSNLRSIEAYLEGYRGTPADRDAARREHATLEAALASTPATTARGIAAKLDRLARRQGWLGYARDDHDARLCYSAVADLYRLSDAGALR